MKLETKIYKILVDKEVDLLISGPSISFNDLIDLVEEKQQLVHIPATREDEAIGIASGAFTGGKRSVIIVNEIGLGNLTYAIRDLSNCCKIPVIIIISPPINLNQGNNYEKKFKYDLLDSIRIKRWSIISNRDVNNLSDAIDYSRAENQSVAIIFENSSEGLS